MVFEQCGEKTNELKTVLSLLEGSVCFRIRCFTSEQSGIATLLILFFIYVKFSTEGSNITRKENHEGPRKIYLERAESKLQMKFTAQLKSPTHPLLTPKSSGRPLRIWRSCLPANVLREA